MVNREELLSFLKEKNNMADGIIINPGDLVFKENVKMNCYYCGKYNNNWRCPPNLPDINFKRMVMEYNTGLFVVLTCKIKDKKEYSIKRNDSSIELHKLLLDLEKWMWNYNFSNVISFIGGSCKLCKNGCGKERCNNPYMSRSPLEAIGIDVIESAGKYGIDIKFPADKELKRIGLLLWQEGEE